MRIFRLRLGFARRGLALALFASLIAGCGASEPRDVERPAPSSSEFPAVDGKTLDGIAASFAESDLVVLPAVRVGDVGPGNRLAFGVFELDREQVDDADIALYFAYGANGKARGPFPARVDSLQTPAVFRAQTTSNDPTAATSVYVVDGLRWTRPGELRLLAVVRRDGGLQATRLPSLVVGQFEGVPEIGDPAPRIHTPTVASAGGDLPAIDTRIPPDSMHESDFADVLGEKPVLITFATPQFCESRVCGPTVDIAEQVKQESAGEVAFIHMEIYRENDPGKGVRPQVRAFRLPSEPWAFAIDRNGIIRERLEGAFGPTELAAAARKISS